MTRTQTVVWTEDGRDFAFDYNPGIIDTVKLTKSGKVKFRPCADVQGCCRFRRRGTIAYHVRMLVGLGMIASAGSRQRRGAVEHFYSLTDHGRHLLGGRRS